MKLILIGLFFSMMALTGCAQLVLVKDCAKVSDDSNRSVCRQIKPWE